MKLDDPKNLDAALPIALPPQAISEEVLLEKYAKGSERTIEDVRRRVARALAAVEVPAQREQWETAFYRAQENGFILGGRINSAAGTDLKATLINCFVQPVGDSISGDENGSRHLCRAQRSGGDHAPRRRRGLRLLAHPPAGRARARHATAAPAGRCRTCACSTRAARRSNPPARAAARRWASCAATIRTSRRSSTPRTRRAHQLQPLGGGHRRLRRGRARRRALGAGAPGAAGAPICWRPARTSAPTTCGSTAPCAPVRCGQQIMRSTYDHAEPGVVFIDAMNRDNNLSYCEEIVASNPCGEQPLPAYGCCDLGQHRPDALRARPVHARRALRLLRLRGHRRRGGAHARQRARRHRLAAAQQQRLEAMAKRRVGLGFTGLGDALIELNLRYDADDGRAMAAHIAREMRDAAYVASVEIAKEKGAFPRSIPTRIWPRLVSRRGCPIRSRRAIRAHGIRNSHLLSIAPTGTISLAFADNASNGIEPAFSWFYKRRKRMADDTMKEYPGRGSRVPDVQAPPSHRRRRRDDGVRRAGQPRARRRVDGQRWQAARDAGSGLRQRAADERARSHADERGGAAVRRHRDQQDRQRPGRLSVRRLSRTSTSRRGKRA